MPTWPICRKSQTVTGDSHGYPCFNPDGSGIARSADRVPAPVSFTLMAKSSVNDGDEGSWTHHLLRALMRFLTPGEHVQEWKVIRDSGDDQRGRFAALCITSCLGFAGSFGCPSVWRSFDASLKERRGLWSVHGFISDMFVFLLLLEHCL